MDTLDYLAKTKSVLFRWREDDRIQNCLATLEATRIKLDALRSMEEINDFAHSSVKELIDKYLGMFLQICSGWKCIKPKRIKLVVILTSKITTLNEMLDIAFSMPQDHLCWLEQSHNRWVRLNSYVIVIEYKNLEALRQSYDKFAKNIIVSQAFISNACKENSKFKRNIMVGLGAMYYFFNKQSAKKQSEIFKAKATLSAAKANWNMVDSWLCSRLMAIIFKSIEVKKYIYIPRIYPHVTSSSINEGPSRFELDPFEDSVKILILSHTKLRGLYPDYVGGGCCNKRENKVIEKFITDIIFHIHGGGFISMSANSHQNYTRLWANDLKVPVFSVDYRLAPKFPYPCAFDDVWQAYNWVLEHCEDLGIEIKKIIVTGDSAGGNLAAVLTLKCINSNTRIPDSLLLTYPAVCLSEKVYTKSLGYSMEDFILSNAFLHLCLESYVPNGCDPDTDIYLSPLYATPDLVRCFPKSRIIVGELDPLHDQIFMFAEKLIETEVDTKIFLFKGTPHGALSYYFPGGVKECKKVYKTTLKIFKELLAD